LRRAAIEKLGLMGSEGTAVTLLKMYANEKVKEVRKKVIEAMFWLGQSNDPRALAFFEEVLVAQTFLSAGLGDFPVARPSPSFNHTRIVCCARLTPTEAKL